MESQYYIIFFPNKYPLFFIVLLKIFFSSLHMYVCIYIYVCVCKPMSNRQRIRETLAYKNKTMVSEGSNSASSYPIKTIVILVQENRSFDHMLGWFKSLNPEIDGVAGSESNPISTSDPNSSTVFFKDNSEYVDPDPGHSIQDIYEQVFGQPWSSDHPNPPHEPKMNGFAQNAERTQKGMAKAVMNGFKPDAVPVYKELASKFGICDRWFASVPASTQPNRMFVHSATSYGQTSNDTIKLIEGFPQKTIFESLDESGFSFGIYHQYPPSTLFFR